MELSNPQARRPGSSMFAFNKNIALVSYVPKKNKNVILVFSFHHDDKINLSPGKPNMIVDYNNTKGVVDTLKKMCTTYE